VRAFFVAPEKRTFMDRFTTTTVAGDSPPSEAWLFAQAILGRPIPEMMPFEAKAIAQREELGQLARFSHRHAEELCRLQSTEANARRDRELLEWAAQFSAGAERKLRTIQQIEAQEGRTWHAIERFAEADSLVIEWNEADHPRAPEGTPIGGQWVSKAGGAGGTSGSGGRVAGSAERVAANPSDPSRWYVPSGAKGEWLGAKGDSTFRLKTPVDVNGKLVHEIQFTKGVPVLDKFALPGNTATIILTGDHTTDLRHAEDAWRNLNPGKKLPANATFHHDLLHATEQTVTIDGKKTKVLVGKMQLVPKDINKAVFHEGSASVAKKYYQGLGVDVGSVARLAKEEARLAGRSRTVVSRALGKIKPGKIAKGLAPLVGRSIVRAIPIVSSGLAILEFADNVEAHGVGGAVVRATPLLGDLVTAHDLGSELAKQIRDDADAAAGAAQRQLNEPSRRAWEQADKQTIAAYNELAPQIKVTNPAQSADGSGLVDPQEIATALHEYREAMQNAYFKRNVHRKGFDFDAAAAHNKRQLRERLGCVS
jgi:hypothetical protein